MNEWSVVCIIVSLVGLIGVFVKASVSLTKSIISLDESMKAFKNSFDKDHQENRDAHKELWAKENDQDCRINNHETRIHYLEKSNGKEG